MEKKISWNILTMSEIWDDMYKENTSPIFSKPTFPTRRWGQSFTKDSTTCKISIKKIIGHYTSKGYKVKKSIDRSSTNKFKNLSTFYHISIQIK